MTPREGTTVADRYRLLRKVGGGAVAAMWQVYDEVNEGLGALKLLSGAMHDHPEALARFSLEERISRELSGRYFAQRLGSGSWDSLRYIVWKWHEGETLRSFFARTPQLDAPTVNSVAQETCQALSLAHAAGYAHADIKPENIFFAEIGEGEPRRQMKLIGFGVAGRAPGARTNRPSAARRRPGQVVGTPLYMCPEAVLGYAPGDARADLWSLAVIVYEALTGRVPFWGNSETEIYRAILDRRATAPSKLAELPASLDQWWAQAVAQDFQTAAQFSAALGRALAPVLRSSHTQRSAVLPAAAEENPTEPERRAGRPHASTATGGARAPVWLDPKNAADQPRPELNGLANPGGDRAVAPHVPTAVGTHAQEPEPATSDAVEETGGRAWALPSAVPASVEPAPRATTSRTEPLPVTTSPKGQQSAPQAAAASSGGARDEESQPEASSPALAPKSGGTLTGAPSAPAASSSPPAPLGAQSGTTLTEIAAKPSPPKGREPSSPRPGAPAGPTESAMPANDREQEGEPASQRPTQPPGYARRSLERTASGGATPPEPPLSPPTAAADAPRSCPDQPPQMAGQPGRGSASAPAQPSNGSSGEPAEPAEGPFVPYPSSPSDFRIDGARRTLVGMTPLLLQGGARAAGVREPAPPPRVEPKPEAIREPHARAAAGAAKADDTLVSGPASDDLAATIRQVRPRDLKPAGSAREGARSVGPRKQSNPTVPFPIPVVPRGKPASRRNPTEILPRGAGGAHGGEASVLRSGTTQLLRLQGEHRSQWVAAGLVCALAAALIFLLLTPRVTGTADLERENLPSRPGEQAATPPATAEPTAPADQTALREGPEFDAKDEALDTVAREEPDRASTIGPSQEAPKRSESTPPTRRPTNRPEATAAPAGKAPTDPGPRARPPTAPRGSAARLPTPEPPAAPRPPKPKMDVPAEPPKAAPRSRAPEPPTAPDDFDFGI